MIKILLLILTTLPLNLSAIVGGEDATLVHNPWQISLQIDGEHSCGGAIISERHILTAGHCVVHMMGGKLEVLVGKNGSIIGKEGSLNGKKLKILAGGDGSLKKLKSLGSIKNCKLHDDFKHAWLTNDIAIITMVNPIEFSESIKKINLPNKKDDIKKLFDENSFQEVSVTGWGLRENEKISPQLQSLNTLKPLPLWGSDYWDKNTIEAHFTGNEVWWKMFNENFIGFEIPFRASFRDTDSGGPGVFTDKEGNKTLIGLVSFSPRASDNIRNSDRIANVFVNLYNYLDWIDDNTKTEE